MISKGKAAPEINEVANEETVDLIVMGMARGSVTSQVIETGTQPDFRDTGSRNHWQRMREDKQDSHSDRFFEPIRESCRIRLLAGKGPRSSGAYDLRDREDQMGSNTEKVLRKAGSPVLTIRF